MNNITQSNESNTHWALQRILEALSPRKVAEHSAKFLLYGTAAATIYTVAQGDAALATALSPVIARLIATVGGNTLSSIIDKVAQDKEGVITETDIQQMVDNAFAKIQPKDYLSDHEFYRTIRILETRDKERFSQISENISEQQKQLDEIKILLEEFHKEIIKQNRLINLNDLHIVEIDATPPPPPRQFVGHRSLIEHVKQIIRAEGQLINLMGMGGIGRTAVARQIAHEMQLEFPGGIFWVNMQADYLPQSILQGWGRLCGQDITALKEQNSLAEIVRGLLTARVREKGNLLIVLNNAEVTNDDSIRKILDAIPLHTPVLVTSRRVLHFLGGMTIKINHLTQDELLELLRVHAGASIVNANMDDSINLIHLLGELPIAIVAIGSHVASLANKPGFTLSDFVNDLKTKFEYQDKLIGEPIEIAFSVCYDALTPETQRLFRFLGILSDTFNLSELSILTNQDESKIETMLDEMVLKGLVEWGTQPKTYHIHSLVQYYARVLLTKSYDD